MTPINPSDDGNGIGTLLLEAYDYTMRLSITLPFSSRDYCWNLSSMTNYISRIEQRCARKLGAGALSRLDTISRERGGAFYRSIRAMALPY